MARGGQSLAKVGGHIHPSPPVATPLPTSHLKEPNHLNWKSQQNQSSCDNRLSWQPTDKFGQAKDPCLHLWLSLPRSQILDHQHQFLICFIQKPELEIEILMTTQSVGRGQSTYSFLLTTLPEVHQMTAKFSHFLSALVPTSQIRTGGGILFPPSGQSHEGTDRLPAIMLFPPVQPWNL